MRRKIFQHFYVLLTLILAGMLPLSSYAIELTIFGYDGRPPKIYKDENNEPSGIQVSIMRYLETETGDRFNIKLFPWKRAYNSMLQGKGGIVGLSKNEDRLKIIDYSEPMYYDELRILVLKGKEFPFQKLEDLQGKTFAVVLGASFGPKFEKGKKNNIFKVREVRKTNYIFVEVLLGRADATLVNPGQLGLGAILDNDPFLKKNKHKLTMLPVPFTRDPTHLGFSKSMKMTSFLATFNKALKKGWDTGAIQKIIDDYNTPTK